MTFKMIRELEGQHSGKTAWIFGKGPSLEAFDCSLAGPLRICINESVLLVDKPTYLFAHDETPIRRAAMNWPSGCRAVLEHDRARLAESHDIPKDDIFEYQKENVGSFESLTSVQSIADSNALAGITGTVHSAIHFCQLLGVKNVKLIGFDGHGPYAAGLNMDIPLGGGRHSQIRSDSIRLMESMNLEYEFIDDSNVSSSSMPFSYDELYSNLRRNDYHRKEDETSHIARHLPWLIEKLDVESVLDIGCSTGRSVELFEGYGVLATGVEVSSVAVDEARSLGRNVVHGCATKLPFADNSFDLVCSADVFEHLRPEDAGKACSEACRVAKRFVFLKIAEREDVSEKWKELAGHPLHLTTRPIEWWKQFCQPYGDVIRMERELICLKVKNGLMAEA